MNSFVRFFVAILSVVAITACGKSSSEQAKSNADSAISELKTSTNELVGMGTPSATWSEEKLARYEALITSCESSANRIEALNGKDGVIVTGTYTLPQYRSALSGLRTAVRQARNEKAQAERIKKESDAQDAAVAKLQGHFNALKAAGTPELSWSNEQLEQHDILITNLETSAAELSSISSAHSQTIRKVAEVTANSRELIKEIRKVKAAQQPSA